MRSILPRLAAVACALALLAGARPALAQTSGTWINVGVGVTQFEAASSNHTNNTGIGVAWRIGTSSTGWGPTLAFNWFETGLKSTVAGQRLRFGSIDVRPIMFGYGYTRHKGRFSVDASGLVGYAFNDLSISNQGRQAYLQRNTWVSGHVHNSFVVKPQVSIWYDVAPRIGVNFSIGYLFTRPAVTLTTIGGTTTTRWNADMVVMSVGVVYGIF